MQIAGKKTLVANNAPGHDELAGEPHAPGWASSLRSFWVGAGILLAVLLALIPVLDNGHVATSDGGVYAAQAKNLADGSWESRRPAPDVDVSGRNSGGVPDGGVSGDKEIPYARHPLFSLVLRPLYEFGGVGGMMLFSVAGVWVASVATGLMSRRVSSNLGLPGLFFTGLVSPLVFDAHLVSAHGMGAGAAAIAYLGGTQAVDDRRWAPLAWTLPSVGVAMLLRSEVAVAMAAFAGALGLWGLLRGVRTSVDWRSVVCGSAILVTAVVTYVLDARWTSSIKGTTGIGRQPFSKILGDHTGPIEASWISVLRPYDGSALNARTSYILALVCLGVGAVALRVLPRRPLLPVVLFTVGAGGTLWRCFEFPGLVSGFFAACPALAVGLIQLRHSDLTPMMRRHLTTAVVAATLLILTIYEEGGATEWGGRFFHVLVPLLVPAALAGIRSIRSFVPSVEARVLFASLLVIGMASPVQALRAQTESRNMMKELVEGAVEFAELHDGSAKPLVIFGRLSATGTSRGFWDTRDQVEVLTARGRGEVMYLVGLAKDAGRTRLTLTTNVDESLLRLMGAGWLEKNGWDILAMDKRGRASLYLLGPAVSTEREN